MNESVISRCRSGCFHSVDLLASTQHVAQYKKQYRSLSTFTQHLLLCQLLYFNSFSSAFALALFFKWDLCYSHHSDDWFAFTMTLFSPIKCQKISEQEDFLIEKALVPFSSLNLKDCNHEWDFVEFWLRYQCMWV